MRHPVLHTQPAALSHHRPNPRTPPAATNQLTSSSLLHPAVSNKLEAPSPLYSALSTHPFAVSRQYPARHIQTSVPSPQHPAFRTLTVATRRYSCLVQVDCTSTVRSMYPGDPRELMPTTSTGHHQSLRRRLASIRFVFKVPGRPPSKRRQQDRNGRPV